MSASSAVAEALTLGRAAGVPADTLYDVLEQGAAGAPFVRQKGAAFLT